VPAAAYPSRWRVASNHIVDENGVELGVVKGFNTNVASTVGGESFLFSQADFTAMSTLTDGAAVPGPGINRLVVCWDVFEQSAGVYHGISSATGAATAGSAFDSLDKSIQRAYAAGRYLKLDLHLLDASSSNGRVPAWARTGTLPAGSGNSLTWYCTNGQGITQTLALRYGDPATSPIGAAAKAVTGFCPNEPPGVTQDTLMTAHETWIPWYRSIAPDWVIWASPFSYGGGTPYPSGAADIDLARLMALDPNNVGIVLDWHTYLNMVGTASTDGYQANGAIDPVQQVTNGSQFYGWGAAYTYPNSSASRAALAAHIAPLVTLRDSNSRLALSVTEFGNDNQAQGATHDAWIKDWVDLFRASGVDVECWWQYAADQSTFNSGSTTGAGWRTGISGTSWMQNATPRAAGAGGGGSTTPPTVVGVGALGVTPNSATTPMTAAGMTLPAGVVEGDLLLMYVFFDTGVTTSGQSITNPAGWSTLLDLPHLANGDMWRVLYKVAAAGEGAPASPTFTGATTGTTNGGTGMCRVVAYSGVDTSALPSSALAGSSGGNGFTGQQNMGAIAGFTPTADDVLVCVFAGKKDDWTSVSTLTGDGLTWTEDFASVTTNGSDAGMVLNSAPIVGAAVAITNKTFTVTGGATANGLGRMFALKPAAVTTTTHDLAGTIVGSGSLSGALAADVALAGSIAGVGSLSGDLFRQTDLAGTIAGAATLSGNVQKVLELAGAVAGVGALSGDLVVVSGPVLHDLAGTIAGAGALSGALAVDAGLAGVIAGAGVLTGDLTIVGAQVVHDLAGTIAGAAALSGSLSAVLGLEGVISGEALLEGALSVDVVLEGLLAGAGALSGDLLVVAPVEPTPVLVVESPVFDPGTVVDVVLITPANSEPWAHERKIRRARRPSRIVSVRPAQTPVASAAADAAGIARFTGLPDGRYWLVGERGGVIRRVVRTVP
jgi:hypothetical protein